MASLLSARICRSALLSQHRATARTLHVSARIGPKKSRQAAIDFDGDELFPSSSEPDEFFPTRPSTAQTTSTPSPADSTTHATDSKKLDPATRAARFEELYTFVSSRIGRTPAVKDALQVRNTAWAHLFGLATEPAQLERVANIFSDWKESGRVFSDKHIEAFVRRCEELHCPELALRVFSDRPRYGLDLATPRAARRLLHALHQEHPLQQSVTLAALCALYRLPPLTADPVSCAMLTAACLRAAAPPTTTSTTPATSVITTAAERRAARKVAGGFAGPERAREDVKERLWGKWALKKVERALVKQGADVAWLRAWRESSGHVGPDERPLAVAA
ncbi:hypothetical protein EVG20_g3042 [Dentipellis fragilis]|uniref:Uncharacterized protein n=1 Tax=Dentipellis fragilis TaxID=205917 RepID=A0A4Y9Z6Q0_9AGAM|nr:hypothetical protein EVG20_g3042 [Dentipellis fragilis]